MKRFVDNVKRSMKKELRETGEVTVDEISEAKKMWIGLKSHWTVLNKILNNKSIQTSSPYSLLISLCQIFKRNPTCLITFLWNNVLFMTTGTTLPASYIRSDQMLHFIDTDDHKAHGCDDISIRMLKICDDSIVLPLRHIFTKYLEFQTFPTLWKRANILPIHKKQSRQLIKNYRLISLLPICGKIFEKHTFDYIYEHLCNNRLITSNQSVLGPVTQILTNFYLLPTTFMKALRWKLELLF